MQSFPDMSKQQRAVPPIDLQQQPRDPPRASSPAASLLSAPGSPALRSSNPPPQSAVAISHVPRPRFNSFSHHEDDDDREVRPHHVVTFSTSASPASSVPPRMSPSPSPGTSPSGQSPLLGRSPGALSFSEKRKIAREQAKAAASSTSSSSSSSTARDQHSSQHDGTASTRVDWAVWRQRLTSWYHGSGFWLVLYSVLLLVTSVGNSISFKKMINKMENYVSSHPTCYLTHSHMLRIKHCSVRTTDEYVRLWF